MAIAVAAIRCSAMPAAVATRVAARDAGEEAAGSARNRAEAAMAAPPDIGFQCLSGMFERNDDVLYNLLRQRRLHEHRRAAISATPPTARTATTPALGAGAAGKCVRDRQVGAPE